jgi:acetyl esterase
MLSGRPAPAGRLVTEHVACAGGRQVPARIHPLFGDLTGPPPTHLVVGARDILLEDNLAMAARLASAGAEVDIRVYPESRHGFTSFPTATAEAATSSIESWLVDLLQQS